MHHRTLPLASPLLGRRACREHHFVNGVCAGSPLELIATLRRTRSPTKPGKTGRKLRMLEVRTSRQLDSYALLRMSASQSGGEDSAIQHSGRTEMTDKTVVMPEERHRMIAETAYFLAQERSFTGGDPVSDWIEAERRVDRQLSALAIARMLELLESGVATAARKLGALRRRVSTLAASARTD